MGYAFQFVTLAGFHALNFSMFELASGYAKRGMASYAELQEVRSTSYAGCLCALHAWQASIMPHSLQSDRP